MTLYDIFMGIPMMQIKDVSFGLIGIFVVGASLVEITPVKLNPWSKILGWVGKQINRDVNDRIKQLEKKQDEFEKKFDSYAHDQRKKDLDDMRSKILDFCNECMRRKKHTREQFRFILRLCDEYEQHIEVNHLKNGEISDAIDQIRTIHRRCLAENSFLLPDNEAGDPLLIMTAGETAT